MKGKYQVRLWLNDSERELLMRTADSLMDLDVDTMQEAMEAETLAELLVRLVLGKNETMFPLNLVKKDKE